MTPNTLDSTIASHPDPPTAADWIAVIVYDDTRAGRRAMLALDDVVHKLGRKERLHPRLWRFDLLEDPDWRAAATAEAAEAGLLIISASGKGALPAAVQHWVHDWLGQGRGTAALAALLGPADDPDPLDSPRVQLLRSAAKAAELGFFASAPTAASSFGPDREPSRLAAPRNTPGGLKEQNIQEPSEPLRAETARGPVSLSQPCPPAEASSRGLARPPHQILLVEDDSMVREVSATMLVRAGYQVTAVEGSQAAWEALQSRSYDLLITDNQMSGLSGLELVRKLRSAQLALPVIMASGGIGVDELTQNQWLQPATLLLKPFTRDDLLEKVTAALNRTGRDLGLYSIPLPAFWESYHHWGLNE